jgi:hypothetical protein
MVVPDLVVKRTRLGHSSSAPEIAVVLRNI